MGENHLARLPSALYGGVLLLAAIAYWLLQRAIIATEGEASVLRRAVGRDWKGNLSPVLYVVVALIWIVPDKRIERALGSGAA